MSKAVRGTTIFMVVAVLVGSFIIWGLFGINAEVNRQNQQTAKEHELVQGVCTIAHNEVNRTTQDLCGLAQDTTHTEFLCNRGNTFCWVEDK